MVRYKPGKQKTSSIQKSKLKMFYYAIYLEKLLYNLEPCVLPNLESSQ